MNKTSKFSLHLLIIILVFSGITTGIRATCASSISNIPLEVKDPLEILEYPTMVSLFPGETTTFNLIIKNNAPINYTVRIDCQLNDTSYQTNYVTCSDEIHEINSGVKTITSWLKVSADAPEKIVMMTIKLTRVTENTGTQTVSGLPASLELLAGGAKWAAKDGNTALYVNWKDNWVAHHDTDGISWGPWPGESKMDAYRFSVSQSLEQAGFNIEFAADIPETLTQYDIVIIHPFWAVEPQHSLLIEEYVSNGGGVIILGGAPCYFSVFCKDCWPYRAYGAEFNQYGFGLSPIQEWFGARYYINVGGHSHITMNNPFGTSFSTGDALMFSEGGSASSVATLSSNTQIVSQWDSGQVFGFTHQYGQGRVYYQAAFETINEVVTTNNNNELVVNTSPIEGIQFQINEEQQITPYSGSLSEEIYKIEMPENQDGYIWSHWLEDGDTNRIQIVSLNENTVLTGVYVQENTSTSTSIVSPENKTYTTNQIPLQFTMTQSFDHGFYSLDNQENVTIFGNTTLTELSEGPHKITLFIEDEHENITTTQTAYFTINTTTSEVMQTIAIISPANVTYSSTDVALTFNSGKSTETIFYKIDNQENVTITENTTITGLPDGVHQLTIFTKYVEKPIVESKIIWFTTDTTPPTITDVTDIPINVNGTLEDGVKINATVTDAISGVQGVSLNYTTDNQTWTLTEMTNIETNIWNGTLPAFPLGTNVTYIINAQDKAGNIITTEDLYGKSNQYQILTNVVMWIVLPTSLVVMASAVISKKQITIPTITKINNKLHKIRSE